MKVRVHPMHGAPRPRAGVYRVRPMSRRGMGDQTDFVLGNLLGLATGMGRVARPRRMRGMGCADPLAENANSDDSIPCVYGSTAAPTPAQVLGNQPTKGGGYEPVDTLQTWLYDKVVTPAAGSPTGAYVDPTLMAQMLQQAAQQYCAGTSFGGPNNPCAGDDIGSLVNSLTSTYSAQVAAKGGTPTVNSQNAPSYVYTQFAPGYNSGGIGFILLPNGQQVPNTPANLTLASTMYAQQQSTAVAADLSRGGGGSPAPTSSGAAAASIVSGDGTGSAAPTSSLQSFLSSLMPTTATPAGATAAGSVDLSFLTDSSIVSGIPNWALLVGAGAVLLMLGGKK